MVDIARIIYLNPALARSNNATDVENMSAFWSSASSATKSSFATEIPNAVRDMRPSQFFAMNARSSNLNVLSADADIRGPGSTPLSNTMYVPNVYAPVVIDGSNRFVMYNADAGLETRHIASNYVARLLYPTGRTRNVTVSAVTRAGSDLSVRTVEDDMLIGNVSPDRVNNAILQGVYLSDARRVMLAAAARDVSSNLMYAVPIEQFNTPLYRLLYPHACGMSEDDAFADYLVSRSTRIGSTEEIATVSTSMRVSVPELRVTGDASFAYLRIGSSNTPAVSAISRDFVTEFNFCRDDLLITEKAIKTYADRVRSVTMCNVTCDNLLCRSNSQVRGVAAFSNAVCSNLVSRSATVTGSANVSQLKILDSLVCSGCNLFESNARLNVDCEATFGAQLNAASISTGVLRATTASNGVCVVTSNFRATCDASVAGILTGQEVRSAGNVVAASNIVAANLVASNTVTSARIATSNVTSQSAVVDQLLSRNSQFSNVVVQDTLSAANSMLTNAWSCNVYASNLRADRVGARAAVADSLSASNVSARSIACDAITVAGPATFPSGRTTASVLDVNQLTSRDAEVQDMRVVGSLAVAGRFTFPPDTYVNSSNVTAIRLAVSDISQLNDVTSTSCKTSFFGLVKRNASSGSRGIRALSDNKRFALDCMLSIDESRIGQDSVYDAECLTACLKALKYLVKEFVTDGQA